jgi:hypothetical protein
MSDPIPLIRPAGRIRTAVARLPRAAAPALLAAASCFVLAAAPAADPAATRPAPARTAPAAPAAAAVGGEAAGVVQVANLVYAGSKSSKCFSDHFLIQAEQDSNISTSRRFHAVKLASEELFDFPLVIMTGEGAFELSPQERENLKHFLDRGGLLLASASCSSADWDRSFRAEMTLLYPDQRLTAIPMTHPVFHTVYDINTLTAHHGSPRPLEGVSLGTRLAVIYSSEGLNDTAHTEGCCCCGGNEINNCGEVNVNILAYAMLY